MKKLLPLLLPAAVLALGSCSSEPSDWRPDKKVSLDMIAPGTRPSDNFDQHTNEAPAPDKGGAIPRPLDSETRFGRNKNISPGAVMSADTQEGTAQPKEEQAAAQRARGHEPTPNGAVGAPDAGKQEQMGSETPAQPNNKN